MNILIVKLSSLGDVLHNLPIVWDIRCQYPNARVDWLVEEAYVELLQPLKTTAHFSGIDHIIPIGLRRFKKNMMALSLLRQNLKKLKNYLQQLRSTHYDLIIETQGLIKSAILTRLAKRSKHSVIIGLANQTEFSGFEPLAKLFYTKHVTVSTHCHAVDRSRIVAAAAMAIKSPSRETQSPCFYPAEFVCSLTQTRFAQPYALCFHATAQSRKCWSQQNWIALAKVLAQRGLVVVFPWGNAAEQQTSQQLAQEVPGAIVPEAFSIGEAFGLIAQAKITIGVDTGLTHLSALLGKPTLELYCDSPRWKTEGYWSSQIKNLGDRGTPPTSEEAIAAVNLLLG